MFRYNLGLQWMGGKGAMLPRWETSKKNSSVTLNLSGYSGHCRRCLLHSLLLRDVGTYHFELPRLQNPFKHVILPLVTWQGRSMAPRCDIGCWQRLARKHRESYVEVEITPHFDVDDVGICRGFHWKTSNLLKYIYYMVLRGWIREMTMFSISESVKHSDSWSSLS